MGLSFGYRTTLLIIIKNYSLKEGRFMQWHHGNSIGNGISNNRAFAGNLTSKLKTVAKVGMTVPSDEVKDPPLSAAI